MAYLALYRKYRPKTFNEVIGQDALITTLTNQIKKDKVGHAYLFSGVRGTGKTSTAKIFARAINCPTPNNGSPCNKCAVCQEMLKPNNMDILEIDAASNNRVDEIRELREKIQYPPVNGRKKVYIIDEVHMLTDSAFNALLKTLEEPPDHAVFILATTEAHKVPETILSRCMRFDFCLVGESELIKLMNSILKDCEVTAEKEALFKIARAAEGSVRDCLSILDKCVAFCDKNLTYDRVLDILGVTDNSIITSLVRAIIKGSIGDVLEISHSIASNGKNITVLNKDVLKIFRDLIIIKTSKSANIILILPSKDYEELDNMAAEISLERLLRCIDILSATEGELKYSLSPRLIVESAFLRCAMPEYDYDYAALSARIKELENTIKNEKNPKKKVISQKEELDVKTIFGKLLTGISENIYLYNTVKRLNCAISGNTFLINVYDDGDEAALTRQENLKILRDELTNQGYYLDLKIQRLTTKENLTPTQIVKELFGDEVKIIND